MTKITAIKKVEQEVDFELDDRIYADDCKAWKIANIIMEGRLESNIKFLYDDDYSIVAYTVEKINDAFKMADKIMELK